MRILPCRLLLIWIILFRENRVGAIFSKITFRMQSKHKIAFVYEIIVLRIGGIIGTNCGLIADCIFHFHSSHTAMVRAHINKMQFHNLLGVSTFRRSWLLRYMHHFLLVWVEYSLLHFHHCAVEPAVFALHFLGLKYSARLQDNNYYLKSSENKWTMNFHIINRSLDDALVWEILSFQRDA